MCRQTNPKTGGFLGAEVAADVVRNQKDLVCEHVDAKRAADAAALTAGQLYISFFDDLFIARVEESERHLRSVIELCWSERAGDVVGEFLDRVFEHFSSWLLPLPKSASRTSVDILKRRPMLTLAPTISGFCSGEVVGAFS
jgi:hypothetical protein